MGSGHGKHSPIKYGKAMPKASGILIKEVRTGNFFCLPKNWVFSFGWTDNDKFCRTEFSQKEHHPDMENVFC